MIPDHQLTEYGLLCTKPVYGLNDAPLAWQLCLHGFIRETGGVPSHLDENTFTWKKDGALVAMATTHVDDIALTAEPKWMDSMHGHPAPEVQEGHKADSSVRSLWMQVQSDEGWLQHEPGGFL